MTTQEKALSFLYGELRRAKIALGRAEGKPNSKEERENLQNKIEAIDWLIPIAIKEDSDESNLCGSSKASVDWMV